MQAACRDSSTCAICRPVKRGTDRRILILCPCLCRPQRFDIDVGRLEANFKRLQRAVHPDLFTTKSRAERDASAATSATLNVAYRVLKDPASRAHYLLQLQGIDALGEGAGSAAVSPSLLMQVMEAREVLEEAGVGHEQVAALRGRTAAAVEACVQDVGKAFKQGQLEQARAVTVAMQYYGRVLHEADEWLERHRAAGGCGTGACGHSHGRNGQQQAGQDKAHSAS